MATPASLLPGDPIDGDECQTYGHEDEAQSCETGGLAWDNKDVRMTLDSQDIQCMTYDNQDTSRLI